MASVNRQNPTAATSSADTITFRVTFSEQAPGVDASDFTPFFSGGLVGAISGLSQAGDRVFDVTVGPLTGEGSVRLDVNASGTGVADVAGNTLNGGFTTGQVYTRSLTGNGIWTQAASGGLWGANPNWFNGIVGGGAGNTADFSTLEVADGLDLVVRLDSPRAVGNLVFGDTDVASAGNWIVDNNGDAGNALTLAVTAGSPTVTVNPLGVGASTVLRVSLAGNQGMTKLGDGPLALTMPSALTGALTINGGALRLLPGSSLNIGNNAVNLGANTQLNIAGGSFTTGGLVTAVTSAVVIDSGFAALGNFRTNSDFSGTLRVNGGTLTVGDVNIRRNSAGTPSFTSGFIVAGGTATATTIGLGTANSNGAMSIEGGSLTATGTITIGNQTSGGRGGAMRVLGGVFNSTDTVKGIVLCSNPGNNPNNVASATFTGGVSSVEKFTLGFDSTVTAGSATITINGGALYLGGGGIVKDGAASLATNLNFGSGLLGAKADWGTGLPITLPNNGNIAIKAADAADVARNITLGGPLSGAGGFTKTGGGRLTLGAANAFTGAVAVNGGALDVDGSVGAGADLSVNSGGVLTGDGTIGRAVVLSANGAIMPGGTAPGSALTVDSLAWNAGGVLAFNLDSTANRLAVTGALTKGEAGSRHFVFGTGPGFAIGNVYTLVTFGATDLIASDLSYSGLPPGFIGAFTVTSNSILFEVFGPPVIAAQPQSLIALMGGTATFSVAVNNSPGLTYQWFKDGVAIAGATASSLTINNVQAADIGSYAVVVSNGAGNATSDAATLSIAAVALVNHAPSLNSGVVEGSIRQMLGESVTLNGSTTISGDLFAPGLPNVILNGSPNHGGTLDGDGGTTPTNYTVTLNYNTYAQVRTIRCYAPNSANPSNFPGDYTLLSSISYDLPADAGGPQSDCPRFFTRTDWATDWNSGVLTSYDGDGATWGSATMPDGTMYKEFFGASGWQRGLTLQTETWSNGTRKKWTDSTWANDNENVSYWLNPRVVETNVHDEHGGWRKTKIDYADFGAVSDIREYDAPLNPTTVLRHTQYGYLRGTAYTGNLKRRLTQLVTSQKVFDGSGALQSKVTSEYDLGGEFLVPPAPPDVSPIRHDTTNFGPSFVQGRGNLNRVTRWDVTAEDNGAKSVASTVGYNTSGSVVFSRDPLINHETKVIYTDSFSDSVNHNTYAYPTSVKDPDTKESKVKYNFDFGGVMWSRDPKGAAVANTYDPIGRLQQVTNEVNGAYTRYVYAPDHLSVQTFTTVNDLSSEFYQITVVDGHGRVVRVASDHPGSAGGYRGQKNEYDVMGRLDRKSNPAEINGDWELAGDNEGAEWEWSSQTYDWQARPKVYTNQDGTTKSISYDGCGCAGGQSVTTFDEMGRKQTAFYDTLGRLSKTQSFNWDGTTVYSTAINTYNTRDQVTRVRAFKGAGPDPEDESCPTGICQETVMNYDGHGRMSFRKRPEEGASGTVYTYYKDDLLQTTTDARGASATFSYNARHLTTNIAYSTPNESAVPNTPGVSFQYDENGNRTVMNDGAGTVTYGYDTLGLLTSETRQFSDLVNNHFVYYGTGQPIQTSYQIGYSYNLGRQLQSITTPTGDTIDYTRDKAGRITGVSGTPRDGVSDYVTEVAYRAWGTEKRYSFGHQNYSITMSHNARMQVSQIDDQDKLAADYTYTADGRLSGVQALNDRRLDRSFSFDHAGRVTATRSASEAGLGSGEPAQLRQDYGYDEFGHMTLRQGKYWYIRDNTFSATYTNNIASNVMDGGQAQNWQYDAEGNVTSEGGKTHTFDAVGRRVKTTSTDTFYYDGDGRLISQTYINPPPSTNPTGSKLTYYLWSSILKENLAQIRLDGDASNPPGEQKAYHREVFIYVNGQQVAVRKYDQGVSGSQPNLNSIVEWNHRDPLDTIARSVGSAGGSTYSIDPLGVLAVAAFQNEINNFWSPPSGNPGPPPQGFYQYSSANFSRTGISSPSAGSWGLGCSIDGIQSSCGTAFSLISNGSVWGVTLISRGGPMTPEAATVVAGVRAAAIDGQFIERKRLEPKVIPGKPEYSLVSVIDGPLETSYDPDVTVYEEVGAISGEFVFAQGGATFGSLTPNIRNWNTGFTELRAKFDKAFSTIQTQPCKDYVNSVINKFPHKPHANFEDLLKTQTFHLYNPDEDVAIRAGTWSSARGGAGYKQLQADAQSIGRTVGEAQAGLNGVWGNTALTIGNNTYLNKYYFQSYKVNAAVLIVHEILHAAGIRTIPSETYYSMPLEVPAVPVSSPEIDSITGLEDEIKKHCAP